MNSKPKVSLYIRPDSQTPTLIDLCDCTAPNVDFGAVDVIVVNDVGNGDGRGSAVAVVVVVVVVNVAVMAAIVDSANDCGASKRCRLRNSRKSGVFAFLRHAGNSVIL